MSNTTQTVEVTIPPDVSPPGVEGETYEVTLHRGNEQPQRFTVKLVGSPSAPKGNTTTTAAEGRASPTVVAEVAQEHSTLPPQPQPRSHSPIFDRFVGNTMADLSSRLDFTSGSPRPSHGLYRPPSPVVLSETSSRVLSSPYAHSNGRSPTAGPTSIFANTSSGGGPGGGAGGGHSPLRGSGVPPVNAPPLVPSSSTPTNNTQQQTTLVGGGPTSTTTSTLPHSIAQHSPVFHCTPPPRAISPQRSPAGMSPMRGLPASPARRYPTPGRLDYELPPSPSGREFPGASPKPDNYHASMLRRTSVGSGAGYNTTEIKGHSRELGGGYLGMGGHSTLTSSHTSQITSSTTTKPSSPAPISLRNRSPISPRGVFTTDRPAPPPALAPQRRESGGGGGMMGSPSAAAVSGLTQEAAKLREKLEVDQQRWKELERRVQDREREKEKDRNPTLLPASPFRNTSPIATSPLMGGGSSPYRSSSPSAFPPTLRASTPPSSPPNPYLSKPKSEG